MLTAIPIELIDRNPDQPRQLFDQGDLEDLAASIQRRGLLQPITVREIPGGRYELVMGERRWRACQIAGLATIAAHVRQQNERDRDIDAIVENLQRVGVSALEEANAYARAMREHGMTAEELAAELGLKQPWRITERTNLLKLRQEYLALVAADQISLRQAQELSQLDGHGQDALFKAIRRGECPDTNSLRAVKQGIAEAQQQVEMFDLPTVSQADRDQATRFERRIDRLAEAISAGFDDGEIAAVRRVNPDNAKLYADKLALIARHARMLEAELRKAAAAQLALAS